jgi:hypothetical protein
MFQLNNADAMIAAADASPGSLHPTHRLKRPLTGCKLFLSLSFTATNAIIKQPGKLSLYPLCGIAEAEVILYIRVIITKQLT